MAKTDLHYNTDEQVEEYISKGLALVAKLEVSGDLRVETFRLAVQLYSAKQVTPDMALPIGAVPLDGRFRGRG